MARPSAQSRLTSIERYRGQVLSHPLAQGISPDEVRDHLAKVPRQRFPRVAYANRGSAPCIQPRGGVPADRERVGRRRTELRPGPSPRLQIPTLDPVAVDRSAPDAGALVLKGLTDLGVLCPAMVGAVGLEPTTR